jgi:hypothetical protein
MNPYFTKPLLIGSALLFGACERPVFSGLPDADVDAGEDDDSGPAADAAQAFDSGSVSDSGPLLDSGPVPQDAAAPAADSGEPAIDSGPNLRPPNNGDVCTDRGDAYCANGNAEFFCTGTHWQRTDNFDCAPCTDGNDFTGYGLASCQQPESAAACAHHNQAWCEQNLEAIMICMGQWIETTQIPGCGPCTLDEEGYLVSACASPGFIGLDQASRDRAPGQLLRPS